jgi:hypothetical protein
VSAILAVLAILAAGGALRVLVRALPVMSRTRPRAAGEERPGGDLGALERTVANATEHAGDLHLRLRPVLREVAAEGLRRRGVELDAEPERAQALLAPETWELVRPERPRPDDPFGPGVAPARLSAVLDDLEALLA